MWVGLIDVLFDGILVIDVFGMLLGFVIVMGFCGYGFVMGLIVGWLFVEWIDMGVLLFDLLVFCVWCFVDGMMVWLCSML